MELGYGGGFKILYLIPGNDLNNGQIWVHDDSVIKLIIDNYRKGEEAHVYIEHSLDELVSYSG